MNINKRGIAMAGIGATLAAVVLGGTTTALWSDSTNIEGATITSGNLDVKEATPMAWADVSKTGNINETDTIKNITAFRAVPGDYLEGTTTFKVELEGDNMQANLNLANATDVTDTTLFNANNGFVVTYDVYQGTELKQANVPAGTNTQVTFKAANSEVKTSDMKVVTKVHFNNDTVDQQQLNTNKSAVLGNTAVALTQVRTDAPVTP